ncbi:MAG: Rne/Rng family ribonuclease [Clostridia bacterium]|nr:Rne/Rng family ribonuclease [Clostridia bacterium]
MKELIINSQNEKEEIYLIEDGILIEKYLDDKSKRKLEGNIYIGKIQNVIPGLQAAFVNVGENKNAFIHLKDILPKVDVVRNENTLIEKSNISKVVKPGSPVIVEIKRDSYNKKGARASTHINLPGRYIVLLPNSPFITVSQKIEDEAERRRLIEMTKKYVPAGMGAIVRTSAVGKNEENIKKDLENLAKKWEEIIGIEFSNDFPKLIYKGNEIIDKLLLDLVDRDLVKIHVNTEKIKNSICEKLKFLDKEDLVVENDFEEAMIANNVLKQLEVAENRKVWLKSGGFITIDRTEALTAIDVNSAKFVGKKNLEETAVAINEEAAIEIAKQIRLRDIGGIIVIDFIDMNKEQNQKELVYLFSQEIKKDRTKVQIEGFTKLNLLELTRKHIYSE